jgi:hypothetical protein
LWNVGFFRLQLANRQSCGELIIFVLVISYLVLCQTVKLVLTFNSGVFVKVKKYCSSVVNVKVHIGRTSNKTILSFDGIWCLRAYQRGDSTGYSNRLKSSGIEYHVNYL